MTAPQYESIAEAAIRSGLCEKTLRNYVRQGRLTGYRLGVRALRLDPAEVDALIQPIVRDDAPAVAAVDDDYIKQLVDTFPPLNDTQRSRLAVLLLGGGVAA